MSEPDTRVVDTPPDETGSVPVAYTRAEAHYFGLPPRLLVLSLGGVAFGAGIVLLARGHLVAGIALVAAGLLAVALFLEQARRRRESKVDAVVAGGYDRVRALSGFAAASVAAWSRTGRNVARLRLEMRRLARERGHLQHALGGAVYAGDNAARDELLARMRSLDERLSACAEEIRHAVGAARSRVADERLAVEPTQIVRPE
jgi:hypothetical protein